ncbi:MAG TPA: hypothetical protein VKA43_04815 [Gammaproteobacteria bacterium]|nr:hypothetical protein [Gammaproteobacteria bacterium]
MPLPEDERLQITLSLLDRYPLLASSAGVKAADASPGCPATTEVTGVIFYPHSEHHGIKEAFEALCGREYPNKTWTCDHVTIRRYLQLASQDFEVRVKGEITWEAALALIEASRRDLQQTVTDASGLPDTAIIIMPHKDGGYRIVWGTPEGYSKLTMLAQLTEGGDSTRPDDWRASIEFPEQK